MIVNKTKKIVLAKHVVYFRFFLRKAIGLMFSSAKKNYGYVFPFHKAAIIPMTMWFVFQPIDVLFLKRGKVVDMIHSFKPFTNYTPNVEADTVIELPSRLLKRTKTKRTDVVLIK